MKKIILIIVFCNFLVTHSQSDPSWVNKKDLGYDLSSRQDAGMVAIGNDLYILGGYANCGPKNLVKYDTQTAEITQLKNLGSGCSNPISNGVLFTLGTKLYSFSSSGAGTSVYDVTTNEWTQYPLAPGLNPDTGFMIGNTIYISSRSGNVFYAFDIVTNTFTQKAPYPGNANRRGAMSFDIGGKGYLIGGSVAGTNGCTNQVGCFTNDVYEYNPSNDTWTTKTGMPKAIVFGSAISHNGKGYAGLGEIYINLTIGRVKTASWYEYNPASDTWVAMQNYMNFSANDYVNTIAEAAITKINDEIYIFGGRSKGVFNTELDNITKYNTLSNSWSIVNDDPGKNRTEAAGFYTNGKIYVGGGHDSEELTDFWEYNIATDTWAQKANLPTAHTQRACVELNGKGYFIGGYGKSITSTTSNPNANYLETLLEYDPATNTFTEKAPLPFKRAGMVAMVHDGKIYAGSGRGVNGGSTATFNMYNPETNTWTAKATAPFSAMYSSSFVIGDVGYVIISNTSPLSLGKYNFLTDSWTTVTLPNLLYNTQYTNQAFIMNNDAYFIYYDSNNTTQRLLKFNPVNDTFLPYTNIPFPTEGSSIIATPDETYFGFAKETAHLGISLSNSWSALKFGANVSDKTGIHELNTSNFTGLICGSGTLIKAHIKKLGRTIKFA